MLVGNETAEQDENEELLKQLTGAVKGAIFPAKVALEIYKQFQKKAVATRNKFRGNLEISGDLRIGVGVYSKTTETRLPALKKFSTVA